MEQQQQQQASTEHYQKVVDRLAQQLGAMHVEKASMAELLLEKEREILQLKQHIADQETATEAVETVEPELVK